MTVTLRESFGWLLERRQADGQWVTVGFFGRRDNEAAFRVMDQDRKNHRLVHCRQYHTPRARATA